jgi:hypothetical protein
VAFLRRIHLESSCVCVEVNGMQEAGLELLEILVGKFVRPCLIHGACWQYGQYIS